MSGAFTVAGFDGECILTSAYVTGVTMECTLICV